MTKTYFLFIFLFILVFIYFFILNRLVQRFCHIIIFQVLLELNTRKLFKKSVHFLPKYVRFIEFDEFLLQNYVSYLTFLTPLLLYLIFVF